jgi:hypothetical protein
MKYQPETIAAGMILTPGTVNAKAHSIGMTEGEPLIVIIDGLIRYAKAYEMRFGSKLGTDYVLGVAWLEMIKNVHALLDGDGAIGWERGISTDSKDNGVLSSLCMTALEVAGFTQDEFHGITKKA